MAKKRGVTVEAVVASATEIANCEGLEGVTLAGVAASLGVRSPSLYAHVDGLGGLRRLLAFRAAEEMERELSAAAEGRQGVEALGELARAYRRFARRSPGLYQAAQRAVVPGEDDELYAALAAVIRPVLIALEEAGVPAGDTIHMTRAIRSALHGFVALESGSGFGMPQSVEESYERLIALLLSGVEGLPQEG